MNLPLAASANNIARVRQMLECARALIFDVDGTLAETEEVHRRAFNDAFLKMGLDWRWGRTIYKELLKIAGGKERIRASTGRSEVRLFCPIMRSSNSIKSRFRVMPSLWRTAIIRCGRA